MNARRWWLSLGIALALHIGVLFIGFTKGPIDKAQIPPAKLFEHAEFEFKKTKAPALMPPQTKPALEVSREIEKTVAKRFSPPTVDLKKNKTNNEPKNKRDDEPVVAPKVVGQINQGQSSDMMGPNLPDSKVYGPLAGTDAAAPKSEYPEPVYKVPPKLVFGKIPLVKNGPTPTELVPQKDGSLKTREQKYDFLNDSMKCRTDPMSCRTPGYSASIDADGKIEIKDSYGGLEYAHNPNDFQNEEIYGNKKGRYGDHRSEPLATPGVAIVFDATDAYSRAMGRDPYSSAKRKLLNETREYRIARQTLAAKRNNLKAQRSLKRHATKIAKDESRTPAIRRSILFDLWDECSNEKSGEQARQMIVLVINQHFPPGTSLAFSDEELVRLNRRKESRGAFTPYLNPSTAVADQESEPKSFRND